MKRIALLLSIIGVCMSCDAQQNAWEWSVKNDTEQTLQLTYPYQTDHTPQYRTIALTPGDSVTLFEGTERTQKSRSFKYYFKWIAGYYGNEVNWQILSEDGVVLKVWNYSEMGQPGQRFFEESSWHKEAAPGTSAFIETVYTWTYEILPEDITQE